jgi:hypothetical protein
MSRANPFGDLDDFAAQGAPKPKPVAAAAIEELAQASGFPSRKAARQAETTAAPAPVPAPVASPPVRTQRRRTTGRNRQINIKATEETITALYRIADELDLPLGAVLERALAALEQNE